MAGWLASRLAHWLLHNKPRLTSKGAVPLLRDAGAAQPARLTVRHWPALSVELRSSHLRPWQHAFRAEQPNRFGATHCGAGHVMSWHQGCVSMAPNPALLGGDHFAVV